MNRDEIKGKAEKAKGYVKEEAGEILDDPELEAEGKAERAGGKLRTMLPGIFLSLLKNPLILGILAGFACGSCSNRDFRAR